MSLLLHISTIDTATWVEFLGGIFNTLALSNLHYSHSRFSLKQGWITNKQLNKEIKFILPRSNCGWWSDLGDKEMLGHLQIVLRITWWKAIISPLSKYSNCWQSVPHRDSSTVLKKLKSHLLEVTSSNILLNAGMALSMTACLYLNPPQRPCS